MKMTHKIAMAAGQDAANRNMKRNGRTEWNEEDWNVACETFNKLIALV